MAGNNQKHMSRITSLTAIAGLITALFAVWALWDEHGFASKKEANSVRRELAIHMLESRLRIMHLEARVGVVTNEARHEAELKKAKNLLTKLRKQQTKSYFVLD